LLDTDVLSERRKRRPDPAVVAWLDAVAPERLFLSVLVVGELRQGVELLRVRDPLRSARLAEWIEDVKEIYGERVLPVTTAVAEAWGRLRASGPLPTIGGLLAATALVHGLALVTRDTATAERCGVPFVDPWQA
jgi:predicted nucleic acid-binding protein